MHCEKWVRAASRSHQPRIISSSEVQRLQVQVVQLHTTPNELHQTLSVPLPAPDAFVMQVRTHQSGHPNSGPHPSHLASAFREIRNLRSLAGGWVIQKTGRKQQGGDIIFL